MNAPIRILTVTPPTPFEGGLGAGYSAAGYAAAEHALTALEGAIISMETAAELGAWPGRASFLSDRLHEMLARIEALADPARHCRALKAEAGDPAGRE